MNLTETKQLLAVIAARYPNSKVWDQDPELTIKAWQMTLDDVTLGDAQRVLVGWFKAHKWAPDPAEIRELLAEAVNPLPSEGAVWARRSRYFHGELTKSAVDPDDQFAFRVFSNIGGPRDLAVTDEADLRRDVGFAYRRLAEGERTERTATVGELRSIGDSGLRAIS